MFFDGGFSVESRGVFTASAGIALLVCVWVDTEGVWRAARSLPVIALAALAALTAASALWTVGEPTRALRWSLVIAAYGALACGASTLARRRDGENAIAAMIALAAIGCGLAGLAGVAFRSSPLALHLAGEWQAAGPLEYPPALATVELAAVPVLVLAALTARPWPAGAAVTGLAVAAMAIFLSSARLGIVLAAAVFALTIVGSRQAFGRRRVEVAGVWLVGVALPVGLVLLADPADPASAVASDLGRAVVLVAAALLAGALWVSLRARRSVLIGLDRDRSAERRRIRVSVGIGVAVATSAIAFGVLALTERDGYGVEPSSGLLHGRSDQWAAAVQVYERHPLLGSGGESYLVASKRIQGDDPVLFAHNLPLELTAELGISGGAAAITLFFGVPWWLWGRRHDRRLLLFGTAVVGFLLANLVDWSWHLAGAGAIWALAVGGLVPRPSARAGARQPV